MKGGKVDYISDKALSQLTMGVMAAPATATECQILGTNFLDLARVPRDGEKFCANVP